MRKRCKTMKKRLPQVLLYAVGTLLTMMCLSLPSQAKEELGRGVVAIRQDDTHVFVSWRLLADDEPSIAFDVFRNGQKLTKKPLKDVTCFTDDFHAATDALYEVRPHKGKAPAGAYTLPAHAPIGYVDIPLQCPEGGTSPDGTPYTYTANDASVGDVDGDGEYEIILKWEPTNAHDNAHDGYTGNVLFDCYRLSGERLWRIDMGINIRAGAHYTQFMVYDLDGDGCAEVVMKTSDGTRDGLGHVIGDATADYRCPGDTLTPEEEQRLDSIDEANRRQREEWMRRFWQQDSTFAARMQGDSLAAGRPPRRGAGDMNANLWKRKPPRQGHILTGNEYLTVFSGLTGEALFTTDYIPPRGNLAVWGDTKGNRSDRYLACVAYLDGSRPSVVMCRGYYTRTVLAAYDWDGVALVPRWVFDSSQPGNEAYAGQGNHNIRVGDIDGDGCDEIVYGSCTIDHDGTGLYSTRLGHGDAMHLTKFAPSLKGLQVWQCHESHGSGSTFRDARTGDILFQIKADEDVGRCMAADIDPTSYGWEMWSSASGGIRNIRGDIVNSQPRGLTTNMAVWWDGDLLRELLDGVNITKYNWQTGECEPLLRPEGVTRNNGTKANPCLAGDIVGDWREEVLARTSDNTALRLYVSPIPTDYRFVTFMQDRTYRLSIAAQNVAYNQPPEPGFYFGPDK